MVDRGNKGLFYTDLNNVSGPSVKVSGSSTDLVRLGTTIPPFAGLGMGSIGTDTGITFDGYGKPGDGFLYSSNAQNGLNIISASGVNTEDYIRFYTGQDADDGICDMFIAGSGLTRGFVGIATESPDEKLHVEGSIKMVDGNEGSGKVLTSDANGVGSWENPAGAGVTIDPYFSATTSPTWGWDVSGQSTNYEITLLEDANILNLTNVRNGDYGTLIIHQDGVGGHSIAFGTINGVAATHYLVNGGGVPVLTSNANAIDILSFTYNGTSAFLDCRK